MIVAPEWVWLHVPKCAGSATERLLHDAYGKIKSVKFDPVGPGFPVIWHQTIRKRAETDPTIVNPDRRVFANIRRLPSWILSRVHFEISRSGDLGLVSREELCRGGFRTGRAKPGGTARVHLADGAIKRFAEDVTDWIRTEHLEDDIKRVFDLAILAAPPKGKRVNETKIDYVRDLRFWFTQADIDGIYAANPLWAALERKVYGGLLRLDD